jgi:hypothetical protein
MRKLEDQLPKLRPSVNLREPGRTLGQRVEAVEVALAELQAWARIFAPAVDGRLEALESPRQRT